MEGEMKTRLQRQTMRKEMKTGVQTNENFGINCKKRKWKNKSTYRDVMLWKYTNSERRKWNRGTNRESGNESTSINSERGTEIVSKQWGEKWKG